MKIFLAGATGAIGSALIPQLTAAGHSVVGTTRSGAKAQRLRELGAEPAIVDALDRDAVLSAVAQARPDAIVHELTALSAVNPRKAAQSFETTNRLRTEALDHLLAAARAGGVERVVAQSFTSWPYARVGGPVKSESDPLDPSPPKQLRAALAAIAYAERRVTKAGGVALRYGGFYGPGTGIAPGGEQWEQVHRRKFPIVGDGGGIWSLVQIEDAAAATVAALERWTPGELYNVVDDDPAPVREWLPLLAQAIGAPPPRTVPRWVGRLLGGHVIAMMCEARGASNAKAKAKLDWQPRWPSWREGFVALASGGAGAVSPPAASAPRGASSPQDA
ncbi:NAD(P)-dependent oxidoreductase [Conexibacter sp. JD483]|uniref:NAD-dependent epimerase/dehydratase family protein n=1 Tax=unclassified Conexibacter TaxID=2627773 RepID=UPI00271A2F9B|nr:MULTISPECIES: NAD(P)-dependent oxidoreductase [unclassified Conexibacter]MDO8188392.1 NAD(P)-dependent oxidoreductase [Conexibacter sp. CPCC 205706]MDO8198179.1 NAD(P)-dependent oxidoreductase [Conexibacter sp. CPCC 205762]MDR9370685.1 NAD(P)-dependent oxidoreductase [Conexibacter sp. JD483]